MSYSTLIYSKTGHIGRVTLNAPDTLNAFTWEMGEELTDVFERMEEDGEIRCALLTGAGRGFCSGANLAQRAAAVASGSDDTGAVLEKFVNPFVARHRTRRVPLVTAVNGPAAGVGMSIALLGDIVLAAESAFFLLAFTRIGLVPDGGASHLLARRVGYTRAAEMALLAERISAAEAHGWGMINRLTSDADLMGQAEAIAQRLAAGPYSISLTRQMLLAGLDRDLQEALDVELANQRRAGKSDDFREGVTAFVEKRAPKFSGK